ncbi:MAG TPA: isochorismatase family protein, partial [Chloroflexi bacterium]|nr:isochorismatase family protein [Chloroflexota bacterium]
MGIEQDSALLVVDIQNCFLPGGSLAVAEGDEIIPRINSYIRAFRQAGRPVYASRDWHPPETTHFQSGGGPWPEHCVQNTPGAEFHPDLELPEDAHIVSKGMGADEDAYSAFHARDDGGRMLLDKLLEAGIKHLYIGGLALDYCVKYSTLDAAVAGLKVTVLIDASRAVNVEIHDAEKAI